jgi:hypothetical protein
VRTRQAHRAQRAELIIRRAYGIRRGETRRQPVRFELLGDCVAVAVVKDTRDAPCIAIKVARELPDGSVKRMLKECRTGFASLKEQIRYFETLYQRYGPPQ